MIYHRRNGRGFRFWSLRGFIYRCEPADVMYHVPTGGGFYEDVVHLHSIFLLPAERDLSHPKWGNKKSNLP